jgi:heme ABC exporter ATP-binding subunit CcmA
VSGFAEALTLDKVSKQYGAVTALRPLSLSLPLGAFTLIVGPNGSGKTTLLRLVAGLCQPTRGQVLVRGKDPVHEKRDIGLVSHQPMFYDDLTCRENLLFFARLYGVEPGPDRVDDALEWAGLQPFRERPGSDLSRGLKQRLALARATLHNPAVLLLDEPFTGIDGKGATAVLAQLQGFRDRGATILIVTHHFEESAELVDSLIALRTAGHHYVGPRPGGSDADLKAECEALLTEGAQR